MYLKAYLIDQAHKTVHSLLSLLGPQPFHPSQPISADPCQTNLQLHSVQFQYNHSNWYLTLRQLEWSICIHPQKPDKYSSEYNVEKGKHFTILVFVCMKSMHVILNDDSKQAGSKVCMYITQGVHRQYLLHLWNPLLLSSLSENTPMLAVDRRKKKNALFCF